MFSVGSTGRGGALGELIGSLNVVGGAKRLWCSRHIGPNPTQQVMRRAPHRWELQEEERRGEEVFSGVGWSYVLGGGVPLVEVTAWRSKFIRAAAHVAHGGGEGEDTWVVLHGEVGCRRSGGGWGRGCGGTWRSCGGLAHSLVRLLPICAGICRRTVSSSGAEEQILFLKVKISEININTNVCVYWRLR